MEKAKEKISDDSCAAGQNQTETHANFKKDPFMKGNGNQSSNGTIRRLHNHNNIVKKVYVSSLNKRKESQLETSERSKHKNHNPDMKGNTLKHTFKLLMTYKKR